MKKNMLFRITLLLLICFIYPPDIHCKYFSFSDDINKQIDSNLSLARNIYHDLDSQFKQLQSKYQSNDTLFDVDLSKSIDFAANSFKRDLDGLLSGGPYIYMIMKLFNETYVWIHISDPPKMMILDPKRPLFMGSMLSRIATPDSSMPIVFVVGDYNESLTIQPLINSPIALIGIGARISGLGEPAIKITKSMKLPEIYNPRTTYIVGFDIFKCSSDKGPALYVDNSKVIAAMNYIHDNTATEMGGGIYCINNISFPFVLGEKPMFIGNIITRNSAPKGGGIAYDNDGASISAMNYIVNNTADEWGGGAFISESGNKLIANYIHNNTCNGQGGGGIAIRKASKPIVSFNIISKNKGPRLGGGIWVTRGGGLRLPALLVWNYILDNTALDDGGGICLDNDGDAVMILNASISGNKARRGGGISLLYPNRDLTYLMGNRIHDNEADIGGGIWAQDFHGTISTYNIISSNKATDRGGGLYLDNCDILLSNNFIRYNDAPFGGGIYARNSGSPPRYFDNHAISGNTADIGAGIYLENIPEIKIEGNGFSENIAKDKGGALYMDHVAKPEIFNNNKFLNNKARFGGAVFFEQYTEPEMHNNVFQKNMAKNGGAVYVNYERCKIYNNNFKENESSGSGGAIFVPAGMNPNIYNNSFLGNIAGSKRAPTKIQDSILEGDEPGFGGGIFVFGDDTKPEIRENLFKWNIAYGGGAVAVLDSAIPVINSNDYLENQAGGLWDGVNGKGGGILIGNTSIEIDSSNFIANYATDGGAIAVIGKASTKLTNNSFKWNVADIDSNGIGKGGAIYGIGEDVDVVVGTVEYSNIFEENFSSFGGAIAGEGSSTFTVNNNRFSSNRVAYNTDGSGGALYFEDEGTLATIGGNAVINEGNIFEKNTAGTNFLDVTGNGGAVSAVSGCRLMIHGNILGENNAANNFGGSIYLKGKETFAEIGGANDDDILEFPLSIKQLGNIIQNNNREFNVIPRFWYDSVSISIDTLDSAYCELEEPYDLLDTATTIITEEYDSSPTIKVSSESRYFPNLFVYALNLTAGIEVYNISNPLNPILSGTIASSDKTYNIDKKDSLLFIADGFGGAKMYSSSPLFQNNVPIFLDAVTINDVAVIDIGSIGNKVYALGNNDTIYVCTVDGNSLVLDSTITFGDGNEYDIGEIECINGLLYLSIQKLGSNINNFEIYQPSGNSLNILGEFITTGMITDFSIEQNRCLIVDTYMEDDTTSKSELIALDISDPSNLQLIPIPTLKREMDFVSIDISGDFCKVGTNDGFITMNLITGQQIDVLTTNPVMDIESFDGFDYSANAYGGLMSHNQNTGLPVFESNRPEQSNELQFPWVQNMGWPPDEEWYWESSDEPDTVICEQSIIEKLHNNDIILERIDPNKLDRLRYVFDTEEIVVTKSGGFLAIENQANSYILGNLIGGTDIFDGNKATDYGGGIYILNGGSDIMIGSNSGDTNHLKNYFMGNQAKFGGAVSISNTSHKIKIQNNQFGGETDLQINLAHNYGGAILSDTSNILIKNNYILNNISGIDSIPNNSEGGFGAGIALFESEADISENWLISNYSFGNAGGIGIAKKSKRINIRNNTFSENIAVRSRIEAVEDTLGIGTDLFIGSAIDSIIIENNIFDHWGTFESYSIYADSSKLNDTSYYLDPSLISIRTNNVYNNTGMKYGGLLSDLTDISDNISENPLFTDPRVWNFNLDPASSSSGKGWNPEPGKSIVSNVSIFVPETYTSIFSAMKQASYGDRIIVSPGYDHKKDTFPIKVKDGIILMGLSMVYPYDLNKTPDVLLKSDGENILELENTGPRTVVSGLKLVDGDNGIMINNGEGNISGNIIHDNNKGISIGFLIDTIPVNDHFKDGLLIDHNTITDGIEINYDTTGIKKTKNKWVFHHKLQFGPKLTYNITDIEANFYPGRKPEDIHDYIDEPPVFLTLYMNNFPSEDINGYYDLIDSSSGINLRLSDPMYAGEDDFRLLAGSKCLILDSLFRPEKDDTLHLYTDNTAIIGAQYAMIRPFFRADTLFGPPGINVKFIDSTIAEIRHEIKNYEWSWGEEETHKYSNKTYNEPYIINHEFINAGSFDVKLDIRDRYANTALKKKNYIVADTSWKKIKSVFESDFNAIFFSDPNQGWICGEKGIIMKTTDGGEVWNEQKTGTIYVRKDGKDDILRGWEKADFVSYISKDENKPKLLDVNDDLRDIYFLDDYGWAVGENGIILKTIDSGEEWVKTESNTKENLNKVFFKDKNNGISIGENGVIIKSSDGGNSWIIFETGKLNNLIGLSHEFDKYYVCGEDGLILMEESDNNWSIIESGTSNNLNDIIVNNSEIIIIGENGFISYSKDNGGSWDEINSESKNRLSDIFNLDDKYWIAGDQGVTKYSKGLPEFINQYSATLNDLRGIYFINENIGWAVGKEGTILTTNNGGITLGFTDDNQQKLKIFPNPSSNYININFRIDLPSGICIEILNSLGQVVKKKDIGKIFAGELREVIEFDLEPGLYYLILRSVSSERVQIFKRGFIVIK